MAILFILHPSPMLCMNILSNLSPLSRDLFKVAYSDMIIDTAAISW